MSQRKTKVFLGAFVNYTNAQNLNCLALAEHLDKSKYEVLTCVGYSGDLPSEDIPGVRYLRMRYPAKIWRPLCFLRGLLWCDVAYLPKPENWQWCRFWLRLLRKQAFKTVEGVFSGVAYQRAMELEKSETGVVESLTYTGHTYSITRSMIERNREILGLQTSDHVLYLGSEAKQFENTCIRTQLADVILIGADLERKGVRDYFELAGRFPQLKFHIVGGGVGTLDPVPECQRLGLSNVVCHGRLAHDDLANLLRTVQLHVFPSRAEGFPKVTLECAAAGVPSLVYGDYGADEWITTGKDGFVVSTVDEMAQVIQGLLDHPERLESLADNARQLAKRFDWNVLVKDWENVIDSLTVR